MNCFLDYIIISGVENGMDLITEKEKQHYVPRFYLKFFSDNNKSVGMYRFQESKIIPYASIYDNFNISFFYGKDGKMEDAFAEFEGKWDVIIKKIIDTRTLPSSKEEILLIRLLFLLLSARTKYKGEEIEDYYTKLFYSILSYKDYDLYCKGKDIIKIKHKYPTLPYIEAALTIVPQTYDLKIGIIINESNVDFITSDNPVIFCNQLFEFKKLKRGFGFANIGIQFLLPISTKILLCMYDSDVYDLKVSLTTHSSKIKKINSMIVNNSFESIVFKYYKDSPNLTKYITRIANNKVIESFSQEIPKDVILIRNRQLKGNYDLSDFFTIKPAYKKMIIKDPTKEEIEQQLKSNLIENLIKKEKNGELKKAIENDDVAQIPVSFRDNVSIRPWVQRIIDKGKN